MGKYRCGTISLHPFRDARVCSEPRGHQGPHTFVTPMPGEPVFDCAAPEPKPPVSADAAALLVEALSDLETGVILLDGTRESYLKVYLHARQLGWLDGFTRRGAIDNPYWRRLIWLAALSGGGGLLLGLGLRHLLGGGHP